MPHRTFVDQLPANDAYRAANMENLLTPALVLYPDLIQANIRETLRLLGGDAGRWRPHVKTAKLACTIRMLIENGVCNLKCATTLELLVACENRACDVLVAYPVAGGNARRVAQLAARFPEVRVSVLVEHEDQVSLWAGSGVGAFVDVNPGMNRTGIDQSDEKQIIKTALAIIRAGVDFRGLHYYDGHLNNLDMRERSVAAHRGYDRVLELVDDLDRIGHSPREVITAGTPAFPCSIGYAGFRSGSFIHRVSPGTLIYCDATSLCQLPRDYSYHPAALVFTRVISRPRSDIITCDAGHKSVSADAGIPTCIVLGHPYLTPLRPSEEHLPIAVTSGFPCPQIGEMLQLVPRHVCPTVNNFDHALLINSGSIGHMEQVSARGREAPLLLELR